jgi:DNA-binding response OmpR family regulator
MLTAKGETSHKIKGFQLGTDDYLVKPFEPLELVARIKALRNGFTHPEDGKKEKRTEKPTGLFGAILGGSAR